ncbi:DnaJ domain-containing protein [Chloroflexota bacterium]
MAKNYYQIMGIPKNATTKQIRKAYRKLAHTVSSGP